jgi:hypothetical protein
MYTIFKLPKSGDNSIICWSTNLKNYVDIEKWKHESKRPRGRDERVHAGGRDNLTARDFSRHAIISKL